MSDDDARRLTMEEKEKELEIRRKQLEEREREIEVEKVKKDKEKAAKGRCQKHPEGGVPQNRGQRPRSPDPP